MSEQCRVKLTAGRVKSQGGVVGGQDSGRLAGSYNRNAAVVSYSHATSSKNVTKTIIFHVTLVFFQIQTKRSCHIHTSE